MKELEPQSTRGARLRGVLDRASGLLAWAQLVSLVATTAGVAVALAASWVAWRVRFYGGHTDVAAALFALCRQLLGVKGSGRAAYDLARTQAFWGAGVAYAGALAFVGLTGLRGITSRWFRRLGWALPIVMIAVGIAGFIAGFVLAPGRAPTNEAQWIDSFQSYLVAGVGFVSLLGGVWFVAMWLVSVVTGAVEWGVERHRREVPTKALSGVRVSPPDTPTTPATTETAEAHAQPANAESGSTKTR